MYNVLYIEKNRDWSINIDSWVWSNKEEVEE